MKYIQHPGWQLSFTLLLALSNVGWAAHPLAAPGVTSLTNPQVKFELSQQPFVVLKRGPVRALVIDNSAVTTGELAGHRQGYNGLASLGHVQRAENLFVPSVAGLNFEHIHDGTNVGLKESFEPRVFPMQLRVIDQYTVELYQPPTGNWKLESCGRYQILEDGAIEYTFECIPRAGGYRNGYIGLFWASYIHQPEQGVIHFRGRERKSADPPRWITAQSLRHGQDSTHAPSAFPIPQKVENDFKLTLVNHPSKFVVAEPWYYGVSHGMAFAQLFRSKDQIWIAQSPSGGGQGNPAWDFQWFIPDYRINEAYGFVMRAIYLPFKNADQMERDTQRHRDALNKF